MGWSVEKASTQDDLVSLRKSRPILREKCYISHRGPSLAPSGQFTFCPHRPVLCRADAPSMLPFLTTAFLLCLRRAPRWFPPRGKAAAAYATNVPLARLLYAAVSISPLPGPHLWNLPQVVLPIAHRSVWGHGKKRPAHSEKPCAGRFFWAACPV